MKITIAFFFVGLVACSGGGGSASVASGSGASVSDDKSTLTVPTGSFAEAVDVTVTENAVGIGDIGRVTPLASPVTLEFSKVQPVTGNDPMQLVIHLDAGAMNKALTDGLGIYAKIKMEGAQLASDGAHDGQDIWTPILGSLDRDAVTLTVTLLGGGEKMHVVPVAGNELQIVAVVPEGAGINISKSKTARSKAVNQVPMGAHPWAIVCNNPSFPDGGVHTCDASDPNSPVMIMLGRLFEDSNNFARLGFDALKIYQLRGREIIHSGVPQVPAADVMQRHNAEMMYNVAYLSDAPPCSSATSSCYLQNLGQIHIRSGHIGNADITKVSDDVIMHEMTHAVQAALCGSCIQPDAKFAPFVEGTATTMGLWPTVGGSAAALAGKAIYNRERPWFEPIGKSTGANLYDLAYQMTQFFSLVDDGKVTQFPALFRSFDGGGSLHKRLDNALSASLGRGLVYHYIRVMALRNSESLNQVNYITQIPQWEKVRGDVRSFSTRHYYGYAPWADAGHPGCYNEVSLKSRDPDVYIAVVGKDVAASRRDGGTATTIALGNGNSVIYSNDGAKLYSNGAGYDSCGKDFFIANTNIDGTIGDKLNYEFELGFD